ncbi:hypothetical protein L3X38_018988 [Prunus dulcis]|uniref:Uncharacterized protein n=1 Tax=Prunus dulcis TaxID=3755 RepID=A0AAD4WAS4_PRUDU|nr:hypothetical protein L3X38_018988 [Prunus dulcis]
MRARVACSGGHGRMGEKKTGGCGGYGFIGGGSVMEDGGGSVGSGFVEGWWSWGIGLGWKGVNGLGVKKNLKGGGDWSGVKGWWSWGGEEDREKERMFDCVGGLVNCKFWFIPYALWLACLCGKLQMHLELHFTLLPNKQLIRFNLWVLLQK